MDALICKRALAHHQTASTAANQHPVVPGKVAQSGTTCNLLFLLDYLNRDITAAAPVHGGCPIVTPGFSYCATTSVSAQTITLS